MKKFGKFCWWIVKTYFKFLRMVYAIHFIGNYFHNIAKSDVDAVSTMREAMEIARPIYEQMVDKSILGFEWALDNIKYKVINFLS